MEQLIRIDNRRCITPSRSGFARSRSWERAGSVRKEYIDTHLKGVAAELSLCPSIAPGSDRRIWMDRHVAICAAEKTTTTVCPLHARNLTVDKHLVSRRRTYLGSHDKTSPGSTIDRQVLWTAQDRSSGGHLEVSYPNNLSNFSVSESGVFFFQKTGGLCLQELKSLLPSFPHCPDADKRDLTARHLGTGHRWHVRPWNQQTLSEMTFAIALDSPSLRGPSCKKGNRAAPSGAMYILLHRPGRQSGGLSVNRRRIGGAPCLPWHLRSSGHLRPTRHSQPKKTLHELRRSAVNARVVL
jgi:hypothetical protein